MAVVSFQGNDGWFVARWAYYKLFHDIRRKFTLSHDEDYELDQCKYLDGMHFALMKPGMRNKIMHMVKETITEIIDDEANEFQCDLDEEGYRMYRGSLPKLLGYIQKYENAEWPEE